MLDIDRSYSRDKVLFCHPTEMSRIPSPHLHLLWISDQGHPCICPCHHAYPSPRNTRTCVICIWLAIRGKCLKDYGPISRRDILLSVPLCRYHHKAYIIYTLYVHTPSLASCTRNCVFWNEMAMAKWNNKDRWLKI